VAPTRIVHSPLLRATETARTIAQGLQCDLIREPDLREVCLGSKEGMPEGDPEDDFIGSWLAGDPVEGAEPLNVFQTRVVGALTRSIRHTGSTLIVAHWRVFAAVSRATNSALFDPEHCVIYRVRRKQSEWLMERA
jgi:broad specificity phosphatase PhoE